MAKIKMGLYKGDRISTTHGKGKLSNESRKRETAPSDKARGLSNKSLGFTSGKGGDSNMGKGVKESSASIKHYNVGKGPGTAMGFSAKKGGLAAPFGSTKTKG